MLVMSTQHTVGTHQPHQDSHQGMVSSLLLEWDTGTRCQLCNVQALFRVTNPLVKPIGHEEL